jgi:RNA polymerase sigma factor
MSDSDIELIVNELDQNAILAKNDPVYCSKFIEQYEGYILRTAAKVTGQFITKSDDEWSIALLAFNEAIQTFLPDKGHFLPFAELVIRRRLYDEFKKKAGRDWELTVNPAFFEADLEDIEGEGRFYPAHDFKDAQQKFQSEFNGKLEIREMAKILENYGFRFADLAADSPKAMKTKRACALAIAHISRHPDLLDQLRRQKRLPASEIIKFVKIPPKILERHRKYIIAAVEIMTGDFPVLKNYFPLVKEELSK